MRILWPHNFNPNTPHAGVFMYTLADAMQRAGIGVEVVYLGDISSPYKLHLARERIRKLSREFQITHAQFGSACAIASSAAVGRRIVSLRGSDWHRYSGTNIRQYLHGMAATCLSRLSLRSFDAVITMSKRMEFEVRKYLKHALIVTIPDPVDTTLFKPQNKIEIRRRAFGVDCTDPWVLFTSVSKSNPIKRLDLALESVRCASVVIPGLELKLANGIRHVQMPDFVACCDVALCTSTHEGWPNAIKESIACGLPFVSTDVSDLKEIAIRHPSCSVCDPNPVALGRGLLRALEFGRDLALTSEVASMDLTSATDRLISLYRKVLNSNR